MRFLARFAVLGSLALPFIALVACGGFSSSEEPAADGDDDDDDAPLPPKDERCDSKVYDGKSVTEGFVCGMGACRKHLTGDQCVPLLPGDGGAEISPCATAFPAEAFDDEGRDENCDGVVDEGRPKAAEGAGFQCTGCAFGREVQRLADGKLELKGSPNNRKAQRNTTDCINSERCKLPGAQWIRNVTYPLTCTQFCASVGATCTPVCATSAGNGCTLAGIGTNLGTYAADYKCVVPPGHPQNSEAGAPLTGDCEAKFPGVIDPSVDFSVYCCCAL